MVTIVYSDNGRCAGFSVAEITNIPHFEIFDADKEKAAQQIQDSYTRFLGRLLTDSAGSNIAYEVLFVSAPISNQIYEAQVKMYFIVRHIGTAEQDVRQKVSSVMDSVRAELESLSYGVTVLQNDVQLDAFFGDIGQVDTANTFYIAKKDKVMGNSFNPTASLYFNDVIYPSQNANMARVTNAMTAHPHTAVRFQIIPTSFESEEIAYFSQSRMAINYAIGQIRYQQGMQPVDPFLRSVAEAFDYYCAAANNTVAYCNCIVCDCNDDTNLLSQTVMQMFENENERTGALEATKLELPSAFGREQFPVEPWVLSNRLVYQERNSEYWLSRNAPAFLKRLSYLFTPGELKTVVKYPYDDGTTIGLDVVTHRKNREKLEDAIITEDTFKLGMVQSSVRDDLAAVTHAGVPLKDFTMHALIVGTPGMGKTYFSLGMLVQMWEKFHVPFLVVEPTKNEYRSLIDIIPELQVFTPGKSRVSPFIINPFIPPKNVTVETYISSLMTAFKAAFSMPNPLPDIFLGALNEAYNEYGWRLESTADDPYAEPFGMYEFIRVFKRKVQNMDYKGDVKSNIESAGVVRLVSLLERNSNIYDNIHTIPLEDLLTRPTVIELNAINDKEQKSLIMAFLLTLICTYTKNNPHYGGLKNLLMIDEAHVLLDAVPASSDDSPDSMGTTASTIEDMIAEVRACGTSIVIADQSPEKVGKGVVGNTNIKVVFRLVEKTAKDIIRNAINLNDLDYERLAVMGQGEAILHHGKLKTEPLKIKTYSKFTDKPFRPSISDAELTPLCTYWDTRQELLIPHKECRYCPQCTGVCDETVKSNADFMASRILHLCYDRITDPRSMLVVLCGCNKMIAKIAAERHITDDLTKLTNCTKIKLLRKILIAKNFSISKNDYAKILNNEKLFVKEEE